MLSDRDLGSLLQRVICQAIDQTSKWPTPAGARLCHAHHPPSATLYEALVQKDRASTEHWLAISGLANRCIRLGVDALRALEASDTTLALDLLRQAAAVEKEAQGFDTWNSLQRAMRGIAPPRPTA